MKKKVTVRVERQIADSAERVFESMGLNAESAIGMFLAKTAQMGKLPFSVGVDEGVNAPAEHDRKQPPAPAVPPSALLDGNVNQKRADASPEHGVANTTHFGQSAKTADAHAAPAYKPNSPQSGSAITQDMVECVWDAFKYSRDHPVDFKALANNVQKRTGMKSGSAYIYLWFLDNLVNARQNKRNIKIADLEYLLVRIRKELGGEAFANACASVRSSLDGWNRSNNGYYAQHAQSLIKRLGA